MGSGVGEKPVGRLAAWAAAETGVEGAAEDAIAAAFALFFANACTPGNTQTLLLLLLLLLLLPNILNTKIYSTVIFCK